VVFKVQETLPQQLEALFTDVLSPGILTLLSNSLISPRNTEAEIESRQCLVFQQIGRNGSSQPDFSSDLQRIKDNLRDPGRAKQNIEDVLTPNKPPKTIRDRRVPSLGRKAQIRLSKKGGRMVRRNSDGQTLSRNNRANYPAVPPAPDTDNHNPAEESLCDVYAFLNSDAHKITNI
jgi:hypothetical protein